VAAVNDPISAHCIAKRTNHARVWSARMTWAERGSTRSLPASSPLRWATQSSRGPMAKACAPRSR
jgi:hypothetical protein